MGGNHTGKKSRRNKWIVENKSDVVKKKINQMEKKKSCEKKFITWKKSDTRENKLILWGNKSLERN